MGPSQASLPPLVIIASLVDSVSASSIECVVSRIHDDLLPIVWKAPIVDHMCYLASGSTPVEGSSRRISLGLPTSAIATESFLLFPPLRSIEFL